MAERVGEGALRPRRGQPGAPRHPHAGWLILHHWTPTIPALLILAGRGGASSVPTFFFFFKLEYSCFTMLCWFLLYNDVNRLHVYIYPLPLGTPPPPIPPIQVTTEHPAELPALYSGFPLALCFTHGRVFMSVPISQFIPSPHTRF